MGKKDSNPRKERGGKKEVKELEEKSVKTIINLHRRLYKVQFKKKAPYATKQIKEHAAKMMYTKDNRLEPSLNQHLWRNGIRNLDRKVTIVMERKKNEDEDAKHKLYTLIKLA
jgi:large subunit ribosomal protein L31e